MGISVQINHKFQNSKRFFQNQKLFMFVLNEPQSEVYITREV
jgi:hypothetical protein